jgi:Domain of unknown function (DUF4397)
MKERALGGLVLLSVAAAGCSSSSSGGTTPPSLEGGAVDSAAEGADSDVGPTDGAAAPDASPMATPDAGSSATKASVRVAHLSPDAPAVDFCLAAHGSTTFAGPVLKGAGAAAGLSYPDVTKYLAVDAMQYDVRLVMPGASDCSTSLAGLADFTSLPALPAGAYATIAAIGDVDRADAAVNDPPFVLKAFIDDSTVAAGMGALRFVHASPGTPAVDVGLGQGTSFTKIFSDVSFGNIGTGGGLDPNGYVVTAPFTGQPVSARIAGQPVDAGADALTVPGVSLAAGEIATAFAIGGKTGAATPPLQVLLCNDSAPPSGLLAVCSAGP